MNHLNIFIFSCCLVYSARARLSNVDAAQEADDDGVNHEPSWCPGYKAYCTYQAVSSQCHETCLVKPPAVHGNWGEWTIWSACSASCGDGEQKRRRECNDPAPKNGGHECKMGSGHAMLEEHTRKCSGGPCPIHGGYGEWSSYSTCTKSCEGGMQYKHRCCINPSPKFGGDDCSALGAPVEANICNPQPCPVDGGYSTWSDWESCSVSCGGGVQLKKRTCTDPAPLFGGHNCSHLGEAVASQKCNEQPCPIDGGYTDWTPYSQCSKSCGKGLQYRSRCCMDPMPAFGGKPCIVLGEPVEVKECETQACAIDGNWGEWEAFGECSNTCGDDGIKLRKRTCNNPPAMFGGQDCPGDSIESNSCNRTPCPVNGGLSEWNDWSSCSATCGPAIKTRERSCSNPVPAHGGDACVGATNEVNSCVNPKCAEYLYGTTMATWDNAEAACVAWGGHLATVVDQPETDKIVQGFVAQGVTVASDVFVWIGLNDKVTASDWKWIDGSATNAFMPWGTGEPSHADHHCVSMNLLTKTWWDRNCPTMYHYVCKK